MKYTFLILALIINGLVYSQKDFRKREIVSMESIFISFDSKNLHIDIKSNKLMHFQIWRNEIIVLNAVGRATGNEFFLASKGKYKLVIFDEYGKSKTKTFRI